MPVMEAFQVIFGFLRDDAAQENQGNQVRESHETVEYVGACPDCAYCEVGADEDGCYVDPAVDEGRLHVLTAHQVLQAFFGIVSPTENCREREEHERNCKEERGDNRTGRDNREPAGESFHRDIYAFESELRIPSSRDDNCKAGHGTNDDGVEEGSCHADKALAHRFLGLCCCGGDWGGTEASFVTENTAGDTFLHGDKDCTYGAAGNGARVECGLHNSLYGRWNLCKV